MKNSQPSYEELFIENENLKSKLTEKLSLEFESKNCIEKFNNILASSNQSIIIQNNKGLITYVSHQITILTGYEENFFIGQLFPTQIIHHDDLELYTNTVNHVINDRESVHFEYRICTFS